MTDDLERKRRAKSMTLRELLIEYPDHGARVIGNGTVHVDPEHIRQSKNYRKMVAEVKAYCSGSEQGESDEASAKR